MGLNTRSRTSFWVGLAIAASLISGVFLWHRPGWKDYGLNKIEEIKGAATKFTEDTLTHNGLRDEYVALCLAIKDQSRDLPEFLQHHHYNMGINRFYLMDDGSKPPLSTKSNSYGVPPEILTFVYYDASQRKDHHQQLRAYDDAIFMFGGNHTWMAFIDADEFIDTPGPETLNEILHGLEPLSHVGALGMNWQMHTSNGVLKRPESARAAFTECITDGDENVWSDNVHIKSIVRTSKYESPENPHKFHLKHGAVTVGEYGDIVDTIAFRSPITRERIGLHHYAIKSKQEYEEKMSRSNGMGDPKSWEFWQHVEEDMAHVPCTQMVRWVS